MKQFRRWQRILILAMLSVSVFAPIVLFSQKLKTLSFVGRKEFVEDLTTIKYRTDDTILKSIEQEASEDLKEPKLVVYEDKDFGSVVSYSSDGNHDSKQSENAGDTTKFLERKQSENAGDTTTFLERKQSENAGDTIDFLERNVLGTNHERKEEKTTNSAENSVIQSENAGDTTNFLERNGTNHERKEEIQQIQPKTVLSNSAEKGKSNQTTVRYDQNVLSHSRRVTDEKVKTMKDQLIRAKTYLKFAPPGSNSHLVKELKQRIKEVEKSLGEATKDLDLSRSALQKMKSMEASLSKASHVYPDCSAMATKLRAMTYNAEEQVRLQKNQANHLVQLAAQTTPKGLHCLSMRLTAEYFALQPEERQFPNQQKLNDPDLHHYAVFSDNVLACAVVVNSTISFSMEPEKIVFHVVTDSLNLPAISMWFLSNPPAKATIQIQSIDKFEWLSTKYNSTLQKQNSHDPRYTSGLNHLRFYLPDVFPALNKILLFDHDVVVQRDLTGLWSVNMEGKVNGAVETCQESDPSFRRMDMFINFSDPFVAKKFDVKACTWAFGMNFFDLREWRRRNLTAVYHKYLQLGYKRPLWKAGSLPLGWVTFYNHTLALDRRWHILGLGYDSGVRRDDIEQTAVIHYDGVLKPWLDIGIKKYKGYWSKHVKYDHHFLQQCNIHE